MSAIVFADPVPWAAPVGTRCILCRMSAPAAGLCLTGAFPATLWFIPRGRSSTSEPQQRSWRLICGKVMVCLRQGYGLSHIVCDLKHKVAVWQDYALTRVHLEGAKSGPRCGNRKRNL